MSDPGYIYVLLNPSLDGLVKIGKTSRDPTNRAKELSTATGVPTPFIVAFDEHFDDCTSAEVFIHKELERRGYRVSDNKEFFKAPLNEVIKIILLTRSMISIEPEPTRELAQSNTTKTSTLDQLLRMAEQSYLGTGDALQDYSEALELYQQAAHIGSLDALFQLGTMYLRGEGCGSDPEKGMRYFKEGSAKGDPRCQLGMARLYHRLEHRLNSIKCWIKLFEMDWGETTDPLNVPEGPPCAWTLGQYMLFDGPLDSDLGLLIMSSATDYYLSKDWRDLISRLRNVVKQRRDLAAERPEGEFLSSALKAIDEAVTWINREIGEPSFLKSFVHYRTAIIGWGQLVEPSDVSAINGAWQQGGPVLPIDVSRINHEHGKAIPTFVGASRRTWLEDSIADLSMVQGLRSSIGFIDRLQNRSSCRDERTRAIIEGWLEDSQYDAAIWVDS